MTTQTDRLEGLNGFVAYKPPVRVAATGNLALSGLVSVDGVTVAAGDRVLAPAQTDLTECGIYIAGTGTWERAKDFNGARDATYGTQVFVVEGSVNSRKVFYLNTSSPTIGTSSLSFVKIDYPQEQTPALYGAAGDGVTDDSAALTSWLGASDIYLPIGTYLTASGSGC